MDNQSRWNTYYAALTRYVERSGTAKVPIAHSEPLDDGTACNLGAWVGYCRSRYRAGRLEPARAELLERLPGWTWGPLRPGPATDAARDAQIRALRSEGWSLQRIADEFALSRQRIHQITSDMTTTTRTSVPVAPAAPATTEDAA